MKKLILPFLLLFWAQFGAAQDEKQVMSVIDFLNVPGISEPQLSPDGREVIYELSESDWDANKQISHIWLMGTDGDDGRQLTFGKDGEDAPRWSPDGKWISFLAKRYDDEERQLYVMRSDGGEGMRLTKHPTAVGSPQWSPDAKHLYYLASDTLSAEEKEREENDDDVYALDENFQQKHLWKVAVEDGTTTRITGGDYSIWSFDLSADGRRIVVQRGPSPLVDFYRESEVWIMNRDGSDARRLTDNEVGESQPRLSPDGSQVFFLAFANADFDFYYNDKLFLMPADGSGEPLAPIDADWPYEVRSAEWSGDGRYVYLSVNMGTRSHLWSYELASGKLTQLTEGDYSVGWWHYQPRADQFVMGKNTIENPGELCILEDGKLRPITRHYDFLPEQFHLPRQEVISWKGEDGVEVEGLIYYPHDYQPGKRYPLVVQTHGGPASADHLGFSRSFTRYNAVLTGKGYVILQPNYRGSTGYGDDFLRDMVGSYFNQAHLDVMAGVDYLIEEGIADPDRMVKMGWSAGGHMTNKIITFTDRFKAASSGAGAVNWIGMYAQSDIRTYRTPWFGGSPWEEDAPIDNYWNNSPLKDISKATTPTLVIVGENDPRVPMPQSVELYRALRSLGVDTHLYVAPREGHGWSELRHRLYKINVELEWFAKYALGEAYEWEVVEE